MNSNFWRVGAVLAQLVVVLTSPVQAQSWPTRAVKFIVPFGPGAGADIGARVFAEKLQAKWGQPVIVENKPGGDGIVAIQAYLGANDDHVLMFGPSGGFVVHPFTYKNLSYNPAELIPIARVSNTILAVAVKGDAPYNNVKEFTEAARAAPGKFNSGLVQGITELTFWGYQHEEKLQIAQVPYRDVNVAPVDLGEGRIQVVMSAFAIVQPQWRAGRIKLIAVTNKNRVKAAPDVPTAREQGYPSLEIEGMAGLFGIKSMPDRLQEKIAADVRDVTADGSIGDRLEATGQILNFGGPKEFASSIAEQSANVAAVVKAIDFKPKIDGAGTSCHADRSTLPASYVEPFPAIKMEDPIMRTITLEEHFASPEFFDGPARFVKERAEKIGGRYAEVVDRLCDVDAKRLAEMDAAGIDMQVLSLSAPGVEQMETADAIAMARDTNDYLADAVKKHPTRFAGFAAVPTGAPKQAVEELERRVRQQGFKGAVINGHNRGRYLDDQFYWPILECAEALGVPIYLHPTPPPQAVIDVSYGGFAPMVTDMLAGGAWGWHIETAVHMIRVVCGGVFDRFPNLQFVIGHMGEGLPFFFQRLDIIPIATTKLKRPIISYLKENVHYTFSGMNFPPTFLDLLLELGGVDRVMFSADYPYQSMSQARAFLEQIPVSTADKERIAHGNAERLFRL